MNTNNRETFIVLLKAVNVSGKNIIRMEELRKVLTDSGYVNVKTYIQSGNIVLSDGHKQEQEVAEKIEEIINRCFNLRVPAIAILRSRFEKMVTANPLPEQITNDHKRLFFTFLKTPEVSQELKKLEQNNYSPELIKAGEGVIYTFIPENYAKSKLSNQFLEKKAGQAVTTRNLSTCLRLLEMSY